MRRRILLMLLAFCATLELLPCTVLAADTGEHTAWSYTTLVQPQYDKAYPFSQQDEDGKALGFALVVKDGKYGYVNTAGEEVVTCQYDIAYSFSEGYAIVGKKKMYDEYDYTYELGIITLEDLEPMWFATAGPILGINYDPYECVVHDGNITIPGDLSAQVYDTNGQKVDFLKGVEIGERDIMGNAKSQITDGVAIYVSMPGIGLGSWYYDISSGKFIDDQIFQDDLVSGAVDDINFYPFQQGLASVRYRSIVNKTYDEENGIWQIPADPEYRDRYGFIDKAGRWIIEPAFKDIMVMRRKTTYEVFDSKGRAVVQDQNGKWGMIDKQGKIVLPFQYDSLFSYSGGLASFHKDDKTGCLDEDGDVAFYFSDAVGYFSDAGLAVASDGENRLILDCEGNTVLTEKQMGTSLRYYFAEGPDSATSGLIMDSNCPTLSDHIVIEKGGKYGYGLLTRVTRCQVILSSAQHGALTSSAAQAASGETVTVTVKPDGGYELAKLTVTDAAGRAVTTKQTAQDTYTFTMPASNVTVNAVFTMKEQEPKPSEPPTPAYYRVILTTVQHGTLVSSTARTTRGKNVTIKVIADEGYELTELAVTTAAGTAVAAKQIAEDTYTFKMPASRVNVGAVFVKKTVEITQIFTDITPGDWFEETVQYIYDKGLMKGTTADTFEPEAPANRAALMTLLARLDGVETDGGETWYAKSLAWAKGKGISDGSDPEGILTREQLVTMLYRCDGSQITAGGLENFTDREKVSPWAMDAMRWAVETGIIKGRNGHTLAPKDCTTRAELAAVLMRYLERQGQ